MFKDILAKGHEIGSHTVTLDVDTPGLNNFVLQALGQGKVRAEIGKAIGDYIKKRYTSDMNTDNQGYETIATGYILYFEKKKKP